MAKLSGERDCTVPKSKALDLAIGIARSREKEGLTVRHDVGVDRRSTRPDAFRVWRQVAVAHAASERVEGHLLHLLTPERRRPAPAAMWQTCV